MIAADRPVAHRRDARIIPASVEPKSAIQVGLIFGYAAVVLPAGRDLARRPPGARGPARPRPPAPAPAELADAGRAARPRRVRARAQRLRRPAGPDRHARLTSRPLYAGAPYRRF